MLQIHELTIENFRCIETLQVRLNARINLLIGDNGSGKTAVLDALAIGLGPIATHLPGVKGVSFKKNDLREVDGTPMPYTRARLSTFEGLSWTVSQSRDKSAATRKETPKAPGTKPLLAFLDREVLDPQNNGQPYILPLFAYYGVSRAVLDIPLRRKGFKKAHARFEALSESLHAGSRFRSAFIWFYHKENEEHRLQKEQRSFDVTLHELDAARRAITTMFPDLSEPHIELNPLRFVVKQNGVSMALDQLSDGYQTMLGLVLDLCARFVMANPHLDNPLASKAVVLIDEVDLHLHPTWQHRVLGDLLRTFPNTQFVLTTHSPYIVEALNNHLKRARLGDLASGERDAEVDAIAPLPRETVQVYALCDGSLENRIDDDTGLVDDTLLPIFNSINRVYDKMRDIEWNRRHA